MKKSNEFVPEKRPLQKNKNRFIKQSNIFMTAFVVVENNITPIDGSC